MIFADFATDALNSKLADTAPALLGVLVILGVLLAFVNRLSTRQERIMDRQADAVSGLARAIDHMKTEDDARRDKHYEVLHSLAEQCNKSHVGHDTVLAEILGSTRRIETELGKARRG